MNKIGMIAFIILFIITALRIGDYMAASVDAKNAKFKKLKKAEKVDPLAAGIIMTADTAQLTTEMSKIAPNEDREKAWVELQSRIQKASEEGRTFVRVNAELYSKIPYDMLISTLETLGYVAESLTSNEVFPENYYHEGYQLYIRWGERREWRCTGNGGRREMSKKFIITGRVYTLGEMIGTTNARVVDRAVLEKAFDPSKKYPVMSDYMPWSSTEKLIGSCTLQLDGNDVVARVQIRDDQAELYSETMSSFEIKGEPNPLRFGFYVDNANRSFVSNETRITQMRFRYLVLNETSLGGAPEHYGWEEENG